MNRQRVSLYTVVLLSALELSTAVASTGDGVALLTVEEVEGAVVATFPEVGAARAAVEAAEGEVRATRLLPDLTLELGMLRTTARDGHASTTEPGAALEWEVPLPWSYRPRRIAAEHSLAATRSGFARTSLAVRARIRALLVELAAAQERVEVLAAQRALTADLGSLIALRVSLGESRELERLRTVVELARIDRDLALAQAEEEALVATLWHLSGDRLPPRFRLTGKLSSSLSAPTADQLRARALSDNPLLAERRAEREAAAAEVHLAKGQRSPTLVGRLEESRDLDTRSQGVSVGLRLPLWNANRGGIAAAEARLRQATALLETGTRDLSSAVSAAAARLSATQKAAGGLEKVALPAARSAQAIADFSYRQGESSLLDALDARRGFQAVALEELEARRQLHLIRTDLEGLGAFPAAPLLGADTRGASPEAATLGSPNQETGQ